MADQRSYGHSRRHVIVNSSQKVPDATRAVPRMLRTPSAYFGGVAGILLLETELLDLCLVSRDGRVGLSASELAEFGTI